MSTSEPPSAADGVPIVPLAPLERGAQRVGRLRRLGAFAIDLFVMAIPGHLLALAFHSTVSDWGLWGRLVGFVLAPLYLGVCASWITNGRSVGKRLLGTRVAMIDGGALSLGRGLARGMVLSFPYVLNGWLPPGASPRSSLVVAAFTTIVFCVGGSIAYLVLFDCRTGRGLHDLAVGSVVVAAAETLPLGTGRLPLIHRAAIALLFTMPTVSFFLLGGSANPISAVLAPVNTLWQALSVDPRLFTVNVMHNTTTSAGGQHTSLTITAWVPSALWGDESLVRELAAAAIANYASVAEPPQHLNVVLTRGYDLGVASAFSTRAWSKPWEEWRTAVEPTRSRN